MDGMTAHLKEHYARMDTEELVELRAKDTLTDLAREILDLELRRRNVDDATLTRERERQADEATRREADLSRRASLVARVGAYAIDVVGIVVLVLAVSFPVYLYAPKPISDAVGWAGIGLWVGYLWFKDGFRGQSAGKRLLKIKVIEDATGEPCSLPRSLLRNLFHGFGLFDWAFVLGGRKKRLGDWVAGTTVVRLN